MDKTVRAVLEERKRAEVAQKTLEQRQASNERALSAAVVPLFARKVAELKQYCLEDAEVLDVWVVDLKTNQRCFSRKIAAWPLSSAVWTASGELRWDTYIDTECRKRWSSSNHDLANVKASTVVQATGHTPAQTFDFSADLNELTVHDLFGIASALSRYDDACRAGILRRNPARRLVSEFRSFFNLETKEYEFNILKEAAKLAKKYQVVYGGPHDDSGKLHHIHRH
jgi:hypothetical protein